MRINIGGDFVIGSDKKFLISPDLKAEFKAADFNIVNLEAPVTQCDYPAVKTGPSLKCSEESVYSAFSDLKITDVTLANNHFGDYGLEGIKDTLSFLEKNNIRYVGGYSEVNDANRPLFLTKDDTTVGIINIAENEWSNLLDEEFGANHFDIINNIKMIRRVKEQCDHVILIYHGGNEYYSYPAPRIKKLFRFFVDEGVDLVVSHHSHCISGYERYNNKQIFYGLGNFLFPKDIKKKSSWYIGLVLKLKIDKATIDVEYDYVKFDESSLGLVSTSDRGVLEQQVLEINDIISSDGLLEETFHRFVKEKSPMYENYLLRSNSIIRGKLFGVLKRLKLVQYNPRDYKYIYNLMRCEAHRYLISHKLFSDLIKEK